VNVGSTYPTPFAERTKKTSVDLPGPSTESLPTLDYIRFFTRQGHELDLSCKGGNPFSHISMVHPTDLYLQYNRYCFAVNNLVRAMEGSLDKGDKCRFFPLL
jgi:hypothetical protein